MRLRPKRLTSLLCALFVLFCVQPADAAKLVSAKGSEANGFGRIVLTFDTAVGVKARIGGAVLVLNFSQTVAAGPERIAAGLPNFVNAVRRDPDGSSLRLALQRPYRISLQEAAEQVFIDLLPQNWPGLPPPLPPEVVTELGNRARQAEAALKARNPPPVPTALPLELSHAATLTRLSLPAPTEARPVLDESGATKRVFYPGAWRIEANGARGRLAAEIGQFEIENGEDGARLAATPAKGYTLVTERDDETITFDFLAEAQEKKAQAPDIRLKEGQPASEAKPPEPAPPAAPAVSAPKPKDPPAEPSARRHAGTGLVFPFKQLPPAALFERAGIVTLVFETSEPVTAPKAGEAGLAVAGEIGHRGGFAILHIAVPEGRYVDLVPVSEPQGWELAASLDPAPSLSLSTERVADARGKPGVAVKLPELGGTLWLDGDGERIAVVTTRAGARAGIPKPQRFVDFELLKSRVGLAVLALSDKLTVKPEDDTVLIGGESGLVLSDDTTPKEPPADIVSDLVVDRKTWETARLGDVGANLRERLEAAAGAESPERNTKRQALAFTLLANGLHVEALGALVAAATDDPVIGSDPRTSLMRGIIAARMGRADDADALLSSPAVVRNPEARLWRGFARAGAGRWKEADADLQAGRSLLERYPEDIATEMKIVAAEAAAEVADWDTVSQTIKSVARAEHPLMRDRLALLRARIDEARGMTDKALAAYDELARSTQLPVAAAAALRAGELGFSAKLITLPEAIDRLERVSLSWHGGPIEAETLAALGRLYEQAARWRDVFLTVRRAEALAPNAASTRRLHEGASALFEDLFLGERAEKIGGIEALTLFFDFKEFAPTGRHADEIVRRLADRLVALDLLDSAEELLEHQVRNRLTGQARSSVAARLATIRLMEGKPLEALQTLEETHLSGLPEDVRRARSLLRARALSDLTRTDLALETLEGETGRDVERLRADILWSARRWREAGEAHEALLGTVWRERKPLDDAARADVIRAGIAYGLTDEAIGLERLKVKFAPGMAESADARTFALLTRPDAVRNPGFRDVVRRAGTAATLVAFLEEYRKRYPQMSVPPRGVKEERADAAEPKPPG